MNFETLLLEQKNKIAYLTINRPDKLNAINNAVMKEIGEAFDYLETQEIIGVIITGAGEKAFVAGADISEFNNYNKESFVELAKFGQGVYKKIENFKVPVIAAVNGFALGGGCELAMACHLRVAAENARFGQPEVNLGLIPGYGGTQRLVQLIGKSKALEYLMTADMIKADLAEKLGLANYVVPQNELMQKCEEIINKIGSKGPIAIKYVIKAANAHFELPEAEAYNLEAKYFGESFDTEDYKEGTAAFLEKRKAEFKGK